MIFFLESLAMYSFMDDFIVSNFQKKNEVMPFEFYSLIKIVEGFLYQFDLWKDEAKTCLELFSLD